MFKPTRLTNLRELKGTSLHATFLRLKDGLRNVASHWYRQIGISPLAEIRHSRVPGTPAQQPPSQQLPLIFATINDAPDMSLAKLLY